MKLAYLIVNNGVLFVDKLMQKQSAFLHQVHFYTKISDQIIEARTKSTRRTDKSWWKSSV